MARSILKPVVHCDYPQGCTGFFIGSLVMPGLVLLGLFLSGCSPSFYVMGPSIAMKGQSANQMKRDEEECKRAAAIDEKNPPNRYQDIREAKDNSFFWANRRFQACMIAREYKTHVDITIPGAPGSYVYAFGDYFYDFDVGAGRKSTEAKVWDDLLACNMIIQQTKVTSEEKTKIVATAILGVIGAAVRTTIYEDVINRSFGACITNRGYYLAKHKPKGESDEDDWQETPVASAPQAPSKETPTPPELSPRPSEVTPAAATASTAPSKVTPTQSAEQLGTEQRLRKLMELRQKNLITDEEYDKAKKDVLRKLTE